MVNDISALESDSRMEETVLKQKPFVVFMHMKGNPSTMQSLAKYRDVVAEVKAYLTGRIRLLVRQGFPKSKILIDPGLGFGKSTDHNLEILGNLRKFLSLGCPILVGASRKSFIGEILAKNGASLPASERLPGSLAAALWAAEQGASILRVHDVAATRSALEVLQAVQR
jgi:dihydropteroate synthase